MSLKSWLRQISTLDQPIQSAFEIEILVALDEGQITKELHLPHLSIQISGNQTCSVLLALCIYVKMMAKSDLTKFMRI